MSIQSPNMNITVPVAGVDPAPQWALDIQNALNTTIDQHNHQNGNGVPIQPAGLNINSDLDFQGNNVINSRSLRLTPQSTPLSGSLDLGCIYVYNGNLYYNNLLSAQVQITNGSSIVGASGTIAGLVSPASATYVSATPAFVFQSNANTPANLDGGSLTLRNITAGSKGITLSAPPALANNYGVVFPAALPSVQSFATLDASGNIAAPISFTAGITGSNVASNTITGNNIVTNPALNGDTSTTGSLMAGSSIVAGNGIYPTGSSEAGLLSSNANTISIVDPISSSSYPLVTSAPGVSTGLVIIAGTVSSGGSPASGQGFSAVRNSVGVYTVTFSTAFATVSSALVNAQTSLGSGLVAHVTSITNSIVQVEVFTVVTNASTDSAFSFMAIGQRNG